jgi:putative ABC transport system permease protein
MKYFHLIWAALFRRKTRTIFTLLSVLAAFLLFGMLDAVRAAFNAPPSAAGVSRLIVSSRISIIQPLPQSLMPRIQAIPGVKDVAYANWFGGYYQEPKNQNLMFQLAINPAYLDAYPELVLPPEQRKAFDETRTGAVIGANAARALGIKIGDKIPIKGSIFTNKASGDTTWTFDIVGIFKAGEEKQRGLENQMLFRWDYFDEGRTFGGGTIGWYITRVNNPDESEKVAAAVDALSANSDHETKTQTEQAWNLAFVKQLGDIGLIVGAIMAAVFFTLILLTGNTMAQAVRERIPELAVLKTIGFTNKSVLALVLAESVLLIVLGGVLGLLLAQVLLPTVNAASGGRMNFPPIGGSTWSLGIVLMLAIGFVVGFLPALRGMRLRIVDALAGR